MSIASSILILSFVGSLGAWRSDIDINRVRLVTNDVSAYNQPSNSNPHRRRSIFSNRHGNDYDYYSSGITKLQPALQLLPNTAWPEEKKTVQIHKPKEDPRFYYQSDAYLKEVNRKNINKEVSEIYPGSHVIHANDKYYQYREPSVARLTQRDSYIIPLDKICVKCPHDRTLIARPGSNRVVLHHPHLSTCSGLRAPREAKFVTMFGPKFGSLIGEGSYSVLGQLTYKDKFLEYCHMDVHVVTQSCPLPKYLISECNDRNKTCSFKCRDSRTILHGNTHLECRDDMKWNGHLPVCKVQGWCESLLPPQHGHISCKGSVTAAGMTDGSFCRAKCLRGWRPSPRGLAVCRKGSWTNKLTCISNSN